MARGELQRGNRLHPKGKSNRTTLIDHFNEIGIHNEIDIKDARKDTLQFVHSYLRNHKIDAKAIGNRLADAYLMDFRKNYPENARPTMPAWALVISGALTQRDIDVRRILGKILNSQANPILSTEIRVQKQVQLFTSNMRQDAADTIEVNTPPPGIQRTAVQSGAVPPLQRAPTKRRSDWSIPSESEDDLPTGIHGSTASDDIRYSYSPGSERGLREMRRLQDFNARGRREGPSSTSPSPTQRPTRKAKEQAHQAMATMLELAPYSPEKSDSENSDDVPLSLRDRRLHALRGTDQARVSSQSFKPSDSTYGGSELGYERPEPTAGVTIEVEDMDIDMPNPSAHTYPQQINDCNATIGGWRMNVNQSRRLSPPEPRPNPFEPVSPMQTPRLNAYDSRTQQNQDPPSQHPQAHRSPFKTLTSDRRTSPQVSEAATPNHVRPQPHHIDPLRDTPFLQQQHNHNQQLVPTPEHTPEPQTLPSPQTSHTIGRSQEASSPVPKDESRVYRFNNELYRIRRVSCEDLVRQFLSFADMDLEKYKSMFEESGHGTHMAMKMKVAFAEIRTRAAHVLNREPVGSVGEGPISLDRG